MRMGNGSGFEECNHEALEEHEGVRVGIRRFCWWLGVGCVDFFLGLTEGMKRSVL